MIKNIAIEKLHEHPDNPRKNIGDVTELAESIKTSGILQNLTVVPSTGYYYGDYTVIIGHRRLAAAKLAGLTELPCAIVEMDKKEQLATMLLENMQRIDLTVYEQAQGIQMMLDLGETVDSVAEKTGFSKSTIRRRTKLLELDSDKFKKSEGRQVGITEYDRLFEIEDADRRNKLLEAIGTKNFENEFQKAKTEEKEEKERKPIIEKLAAFAELNENISGKKFVCSVTGKNIDAIEINDAVKYYFIIEPYGIYLYRDFTEEEKSEIEENNIKRHERELKEKELKEAWKTVTARLFKLRIKFLKSKKNTISSYCDFIIKAAVKSFSKNSYYNETNIKKIIGVGLRKEGFAEIAEANPMFVLMAIIYHHLADDPSVNCYNREYKFDPQRHRLSEIYDFLVGLGYELSDEEQAVLDGTHELYVRED